MQNEEAPKEATWLKNNWFYETIDEKKLKSIFYFTLVWNIFEKERDAKTGMYPKKIAEKIHSELKDNEVSIMFSHFKERYIIGDETNAIFKNFKFAKDETDKAGIKHRKTVQKTLLASDPSKQEKIEALLLIAFRLRNNLYHGVKEVNKLYEQNENFHQINKLLMKIIDKWPKAKKATENQL